MRGISWLAERPLSFLRRTLLHGVSLLVIGKLHWNLSTHSNFGCGRTIAGVMHEVLRVFLGTGVTELGILRQPWWPWRPWLSSLGESSVMTSSARQEPDTQPKKWSLLPDNADVTGTICKGQRSNYGEHARIVTLCLNLHSSTCFCLRRSYLRAVLNLRKRSQEYG
jgi:hypothetical protein